MKPRGTAFGPGDFAARLLASTIMVFASWNPSGYSFADWLEQAWTAGSLGAIHAFVGVLRGHSMTLFAWIALSGVALLLALGLSWSYLWRRLTGQVDTDDFSPD